MSEHDAISPVLIALFKGVIYRENDTTTWQQLLRHEGRIQDYVSLLGLLLNVNEDEGFAFLRNRDAGEDETELPRLIPRRRLSYPVSLTLVLLRRRLADHDAVTGDERVILDTDEVIEMVRTFLPGGSTEARMVDRMTATLRRIADMGFIRFVDREGRKLEIKRILSAFVDAQWMNEFDQRLQEYAEHAVQAEDGHE
ncbi:MAG: DUF4194 domain-containing protein [Spirochaeta sp.]